MSQFNCVVPFIPPKSRNHHDICLNKTEDEIEKIMTLFVKSASNTTQGTPIIFVKITLAYSQGLSICDIKMLVKSNAIGFFSKSYVPLLSTA